MTSKTLDRIIAAIFVLMLVIGLTGLGSGMGLAYYIRRWKAPEANVQTDISYETADAPEAASQDDAIDPAD